MTHIIKELPKDFSVLIKTVSSESDRGAVIACTEYLLLNCRNLLGKGFENISFANAISIIKRFIGNKTLTDSANALGKLRNKAGHSYKEFSLDDTGQLFSNNLRAQLQKNNIYKEVMEMPEIININKINSKVANKIILIVATFTLVTHFEILIKKLDLAKKKENLI